MQKRKIRPVNLGHVPVMCVKVQWLYNTYVQFNYNIGISVHLHNSSNQCFLTAGPRTGTEPWHQLYRAARDFPGTDN